MSIQPVDRLKHYAFILRNADHEAYKAFMEALEAYNLDAMRNMVQAPPDQVLKMQGRAEQVCDLIFHLNSPKQLPQQKPAAS